MFAISSHWRTCDQKQTERKNRIKLLPDSYLAPSTKQEDTIVSSSIHDIVANVSKGEWTASTVLKAFSKRALQAHEQTNCLTEVLISDARAWATNLDATGSKEEQPLKGLPVSLKDSVTLKGRDSTIGYSRWANKPCPEDSPLVKMLKDAGAIPFVKTAVPITLMSFESTNDLWGRCSNPYNKAYSPGGSSGGESALIAFGGSRIGIGTDVAGSVRIPAHFSGIYAIRSSTGRFPKPGSVTSMPGQEGVPSVCSPMAKTLDDLEYFWKACMSMKPWEYDYTCHPIPWRNVQLPSKLKFGIMQTDGIVTPSPACERALKMVIEALKKNGHDVSEFNPPSPYDGILTGSQLIIADGGETMLKPFQWFEHNDRGVTSLLSIYNTPKWLKKIYAFCLRHFVRDEVTAGLIENLHRKTVAETWVLNARREGYKKQWFESWKKEGLDFVLCVPNALPAVPAGGMNSSVASCGYTFLFNIIDYTAGVIPVTTVDATLDDLDGSFRPTNWIERGAYKNYDSRQMHGLPIGVQIVGRRLEEEKVIEGMKEVERCLKEVGIVWTPFGTLEK